MSETAPSHTGATKYQFENFSGMSSFTFDFDKPTELVGCAKVKLSLSFENGTDAEVVFAILRKVDTSGHRRSRRHRSAHHKWSSRHAPRVTPRHRSV